MQTEIAIEIGENATWCRFIEIQINKYQCPVPECARSHSWMTEGGLSSIRGISRYKERDGEEISTAAGMSSH